MTTQQLNQNPEPTTTTTSEVQPSDNGSVRPDTPTYDPKRMLQLRGYAPICLNFTSGRLLLCAEKGMKLSDIESDILGKMFLDPIKLAQASWALFEDRIKAAGIADEKVFLDLLDAEANHQLFEGMKESVREFFPWGGDYIAQIEELLDNMKEAMRGAQTPTTTDSSAPSGNAPESSE